MNRIRPTLGHMFSALHNRNYRLYFTGQAISLSGTWMQGVAQAWLVLRLTGSGTYLGLVTALQFLPVLLFGAWGGVLADRFDKRRILYCTQTVAGLQAVVLGTVVATGSVQLWMVFALAACFGMVNAIDNPARQTFVLEMVGPDDLTNAVTLSSVVVNAARVVGPALAGILIAKVGLALCFLLNGASYLAVLFALFRMDGTLLRPSPRQPKAKGQLREGLRYVWHTPALRSALGMMAIIGTLAYEFQVVLPLVARTTFHGDAGTYAAMTSSMGVGAVIGGLLAAARRTAHPAALVRTTVVFGVFILAAAAAPTLPLEIVALLFVGGSSITFLALANSTLQLTAAPEMRGRVMALWAVAFLGSTPIGGPIMGFIGQHVGPRWALTVGGTATLVAAALAGRTLLKVRRADEAEAGAGVPGPPATVPGAGHGGGRAEVAGGTANVHSADVHTANVHTAEEHTAEEHTADVHSADVHSADVHTADVHTADAGDVALDAEVGAS